jgi:hypothetical protein
MESPEEAERLPTTLPKPTVPDIPPFPLEGNVVPIQFIVNQIRQNSL